MSLEENRALVRRIPEEVWSRGDMAAADAVLSAEFVNHNPAFGHPPTREGYKQTVAAFRAAFPDLSRALEAAQEQGGSVITAARARRSRDANQRDHHAPQPLPLVEP